MTNKNPEWSQALVAHVAASIGATPADFISKRQYATHRGGVMVAIMGHGINGVRTASMLGYGSHIPALWHRDKINREGFPQAAWQAYSAAAEWMRAKQDAVDAEESQIYAGRTRAKRPTAPPWSREEIEQLHRALRETPTQAAVRAAIPTRGRRAIQKKMRALGLTYLNAAQEKRRQNAKAKAADALSAPRKPKPAAAPEPAPKPRISAVPPSNRQDEVRAEMRRREQSRRRLELDGGNLSTMRRAAL